MMFNNIVVCPKCKARILPKADGTCPSCQASIQPPAAVDHGEDAQKKAPAAEKPASQKSVPAAPKIKESQPVVPLPAPPEPARAESRDQPERTPMDGDSHPGEKGNRNMTTEYSEVLLEAARPELYRVNAFRVMELPVDATPRDLTKRQQIVELAINTKLPIPPGSGRALPMKAAADPNALREALQRLRDPERRLVDEFFWFWPHQLNMSNSDEALRALAHGDAEAARQVWGSQEREQSEANISVHNLAVMYHALALDLEERMGNGSLSADQKKQRDDYWAQAFKRWKILLEYENFWSRLTMRIRDLDDPRLTTGMARRMRTSLPLTLLIINAQLAVAAAERGATAEAQRHRKIMDESGFGQEVIEEALRRALGPTREMIKSLCKAAQADASADPAHADRVTRWLLEQARPRLIVLDCLLPANHPTRGSLHDDVAQQMLSCQILFGNKTENWEVSLELLKHIMPIAVGPFIRTRIEENIKVVQTNLEYDRCWFCQKNKKDEKSTLEIKMHGEIKRIPIFQYGRSGTRVEWKYRSIKVPRCESCQKVHAGVDKYTWIGVVIGALVGLVGCISITSSSSSDATCGGIFVLVVAAIIGGALGAAIGKGRAPKGIRPASATDDFPAIKELKSKGWQMGEKPQGVQ